MAAYQEFLTEKSKIDLLTEQGYFINKVTEHLDGANVEFKKGEAEEVLFIRTADARKYFSSIIIKQQKARSLRKL